MGRFVNILFLSIVILPCSTLAWDLTESGWTDGITTGPITTEFYLPPVEDLTLAPGPAAEPPAPEPTGSEPIVQSPAAPCDEPLEGREVMRQESTYEPFDDPIKLTEGYDASGSTVYETWDSQRCTYVATTKHEGYFSIERGYSTGPNGELYFISAATYSVTSTTVWTPDGEVTHSQDYDRTELVRDGSITNVSQITRYFSNDELRYWVQLSERYTPDGRTLCERTTTQGSPKPLPEGLGPNDPLPPEWNPNITDTLTEKFEVPGCDTEQGPA